MEPKNMKQYQNLLWMKIPQSKRTEVRGTVSTGYLDPTHECYIELTVLGTEPVYYVGDARDQAFREPKVPEPEYGSWMSVKNLRMIVDNIASDSDEVLVCGGTDRPLILNWKSGDDNWKAMIAPRIKPEEDE